jgi:hypothetical protein
MSPVLSGHPHLSGEEICAKNNERSGAIHITGDIITMNIEMLGHGKDATYT